DDDTFPALTSVGRLRVAFTGATTLRLAQLKTISGNEGVSIDDNGALASTNLELTTIGGGGGNNVEVLDNPLLPECDAEHVFIAILKPGTPPGAIHVQGNFAPVVVATSDADLAPFDGETCFSGTLRIENAVSSLASLAQLQAVT